MHKKFGLYQGALYGGLFDMHVSLQDVVPLYLLKNKWYYPLFPWLMTPIKKEMTFLSIISIHNLKGQYNDVYLLGDKNFLMTQCISNYKRLW